MAWSDSFKRDPKYEYLTKILTNADKAANAIRDLAEDINSEGEKFSQDEYLYVFLEFVYFYLHITDRTAFGHMNEQRRDSLMTELEEICISSVINSLCQKWPDDMKEKVKQEAMDSFYISMEEYSRYEKPFPEKDGSAKDTLFWEFGKTISKLAGREDDIRIIVAAQKMVANSLKFLNLKSFIEKVK